MKPDVSIKQSEVDINNYQAVEQDSDENDGFGSFVQHRAQIMDADKTSNLQASTSGETETRKRSRSTSSVKQEADLQPTKHSRGRSSSRITANDTPVFLHDPEVQTMMQKSEKQQNL